MSLSDAIAGVNEEIYDTECVLAAAHQRAAEATARLAKLLELRRVLTEQNDARKAGSGPLRLCQVPGCGKRHWARDRCRTCYWRQYKWVKRHGAAAEPAPPLPVARTPLLSGGLYGDRGVVLVDTGFEDPREGLAVTVVPRPAQCRG